MPGSVGIERHAESSRPKKAFSGPQAESSCVLSAPILTHPGRKLDQRWRSGLDIGASLFIHRWMLWIALAQLTAAQPINEGTWFRLEDVPVRELSDADPRTVFFRLTVRPDGTLQGCQVEVKSGLTAVDKLTCNLARRRARFKPATAANGVPTYGVYRNRATWAVNPGKSYISPVDIELQVDALPSGQRAPASVNVTFAADAEGHPTACVAGETKDQPVLVRLACGEVVRAYQALPPTDDAGAPVASVQNAIVAFVIKDSVKH
jgi:hypothetical protein